VSKLFDESLIEKHFPYKSFNPGQREAIVSIVNAFLSEKKHVVADLPTGIGKSAIATTVHRVLKDVKKSHRTTIVTATKNLQDQYENEDPGIFSLKGKTNYFCPQGVGPYNSGKCRQMVAEGNCNKSVICPYYKKRTQWCKVADLRLTNTSVHIILVNVAKW
jgi:Rad3-related DNA helicase